LHAISGNLCRCTGYRPIRDAALALGPRDPGDPLSRRTTRPAPVPTTGARPGFVRPSSLDEALTLLAARTEAQVVAGATDTGVEVNLRGARPALTIAIDRLDELRTFSWPEPGTDDGRVTLGAGLTLTEVRRLLAGRVPLLDEMLGLFASPLIRNSATLGGNLATASPIGDAAPALLALDARVELVSAGGSREVPLAEFFTGYR